MSNLDVYELAILIKEFYNHWEEEHDSSRHVVGILPQPTLLDFAQWLEKQDTTLNKARHE